MPKNVAQWTGFAVTAIIVLGRDQDVLAALPIGVAAGLLASFFASLAREEAFVRIRNRRRR